MPNHLSNYSERGPHEDINQLVDTMSPAKKRKRSTADHSQTETTYKRTSMKGNHMNGTAEAFNESSNDFSHPLGHTHEASNTAAAALAAQLHVPEASFISTGTTGENDRPLDNSFDNTQGSPFSLSAPYPPTAGTAAQVQAARDASNSAQGRPQVGSEEWNRIRRDNHKEVERRRRETINEGINELAKIVPGCEKNKGSILARAVTYINDLKQREEVTVDQRTLEKVVLEQAVHELSTRNGQLQEHHKDLRAELERYKKRFGELGSEDEDDGKRK